MKKPSLVWYLYFITMKKLWNYFPQKKIQTRPLNIFIKKEKKSRFYSLIKENKI